MLRFVVKPPCDQALSQQCGDPHLAGERSEDVRTPEAPSVRARVDQLRRPAAVAFDSAQAEELGLEDHSRSTGTRNAHAPGQLRSERGGRMEGGSLKAVR